MEPNDKFETAALAAVDHDRVSVATMLHNTLSQSLNAYRIFAALHARHLASSEHPELQSAQLLISELKEVSRDLDDVLQMIAPASFGIGELRERLSALCQCVARRVPCQLRCAQLEIPLNVARDVYEIVREGLFHLSIDEGVEELEIAIIAENETLQLSIFARPIVKSLTQSPADEWSLKLLSARVKLAGGTLQLDCSTANAMSIVCTLPLSVHPG